MNNNRKLTELFAEVGQMMADGCKDCGGNGKKRIHHLKKVDTFPGTECTHVTVEPCPTCQKWREMAGLCWHEWIKEEVTKGRGPFTMTYCSCGYKTRTNHYHGTNENIRGHLKQNPDYTAPTIKLALVELGEWGKFTYWLWWSYISQMNMREDYTDILTTDKELPEPAISYLEAISK